MRNVVVARDGNPKEGFGERRRFSQATKEKGNRRHNEIFPRNLSVNLNSVLEKSVEADFSRNEDGEWERLVTVVPW